MTYNNSNEYQILYFFECNKINLISEVLYFYKMIVLFASLLHVQFNPLSLY